MTKDLIVKCPVKDIVKNFLSEFEVIWHNSDWKDEQKLRDIKEIREYYSVK